MYGILLDKSGVEAVVPFHDDSLIMKSAGSIKLSLEDLATFYKT